MSTTTAAPEEVDEMDAELAELERLANGGGMAGGPPSMDDSLDVDLSDVEVNLGPVDRAWYACEIADAVRKVAGTGVPFLEIKLRIFAGPNKARVTWDRLMLDGKGKKRLPVFLSAIDLYNPDTKRIQLKSVKDLVGKRLWALWEIEIGAVVEDRDNPGQTKKLRDRNVVEPWNGYENINKWAIPADPKSADEQAASAVEIDEDSDPFADDSEKSTVEVVDATIVVEGTPEAVAEVIEAVAEVIEEQASESESEPTIEVEQPAETTETEQTEETPTEPAPEPAVESAPEAETEVETPIDPVVEAMGGTEAPEVKSEETTASAEARSAADGAEAAPFAEEETPSA